MTIARIIELLSEFTKQQQQTHVSAVYVAGDSAEDCVRLFPGAGEPSGDGEAFAMVEGVFFDEEAKQPRKAACRS